jgi:DNA-binding MarR family transcriptional regulator
MKTPIRKEVDYNAALPLQDLGNGQLTMSRTPQPADDKLVHLHHLMRWTLRAFYWLDESLQNLLEQDGWSRASHTQTMIILAVGEGISRPSDLARHLGISRQAIHQVIGELMRKGLVTLEDDPDNKRSKIVRFSPKAVKIRQSAIKAVNAIEREVAHRLGQKTYLGLTAGLSKNWGEPVGSQAPAKTTGRVPARSMNRRAHPG